jgi:CubicO group peptidase (beta-lactamase class C family)
VIAGLAEAGRLSLDDPVAAHVPELRSSGWAGRATLRDLLANRSGLALRAGLEFGFERRKDQDDGALSRLVADAAAGGPAGDFWSYTNVGWCVLGRVIETAAGAAWEDAMQRHLFDRAGMGETAFVTGGASERRAIGHEVTADGPVPVAPLTARAYGPAGASAVTTVTDLLRFAALHLQDPALASLRAVHAEVPIYGWLDSWCLGWARFDWDGGQVWGWDGLVNGERSVLRIVPGQQAVAVLDGGHFAALTGDDQCPVPALDAQGFNVGAGGFGDAQPVERQQGDQRVLRGVAKASGDQQRADLTGKPTRMITQGHHGDADRRPGSPTLRIRP